MLIQKLPTAHYCLTYECYFLKFAGGEKLYGFTEQQTLTVIKEMNTCLTENKSQLFLSFGTVTIPYLTREGKSILLDAIIFTAEYGPVRIKIA